MKPMYFVPEEQLVRLASTRSGRISYMGYNFQCAYAVARLASMVTAKPLPTLTDYPTHLRYDWGEDLDEVLQDGTVCFTQCKRVNDIGKAANLANVLIGFAPKWLWTPKNDRDQISFRLVSCDPRFKTDFKKEAIRTSVWSRFEKVLKTAPSLKSDRHIWQEDALATGFLPLFETLWEKTSFYNIDANIVTDDPAGSLFQSEREALQLLFIHDYYANSSSRKPVLLDLRCLVNENLIAFDPQNNDYPVFETRTPKTIDSADVRYALSGKKEGDRLIPFKLIDRVALSKARVLKKKKFLFESPEWQHVVHGTDNTVKFVERAQTGELRTKIREFLIQPLLDDTSNLPVLSVIGPPGAGKSTLVRRVAATLVESGEVVVADAGLILSGGPSDQRSYAEHLQRLANAGRPVLLLLDDPFFEETGWCEFLLYLKPLVSRLAVIAASPDFSYQQYRARISRLSCHEFRVAPPSSQERKLFAEMYGRDAGIFDEDANDFLVMVAQAEAGEPFAKIMERLWDTLNRGPLSNNDLPFKELPWEVRAFWFVCFLHRYDMPFPLPVLKEALKLSGGTGMEISVETALEKLKAQSGWSIFIHHSTPATSWKGTPDFISTAHPKIAAGAWDRRPCAWLDRDAYLILVQSTLLEPMSLRNVAIAAGKMAKLEPKSTNTFATELIDLWNCAAADPGKVETRTLCSLISLLMMNAAKELVHPFRETLRTRATGKDGWLAAQQLWMVSSDEVRLCHFPTDIDLDLLLDVADFSIAPKRATQFFQLIKGEELRNTLHQRLFQCLDTGAECKIDSNSLVWLLSHAPAEACAKRLSCILSWLGLESHHDDTFVRTQYLAFLQKLPVEFDGQRQEAVSDTANWLKLKRHDSDTAVRTQYLVFLQKLPIEFDRQRQEAVSDTANWLKRHDSDTAVRTQYLVFLQKLPVEFDGQRQEAVSDTANWLKRHDSDTAVRTQYLAFLQGQPEEMLLGPLEEMSAWLKLHPDSHNVRCGYLALLRAVSSPALEPLRLASDEHHQRVIAKNPGCYNHNFDYAKHLFLFSQYEDSIAQCDIVLKQSKHHQMARRQRALALQKLSRMSEAETEFKNAISWARKKKESEAIFHTSFGEFYLEARRWQDAISSFQQAQMEFPDYFGNHSGIARAHIGLTNIDEARIALQRALEDPNLKPPESEEIANILDSLDRSGGTQFAGTQEKVDGH